MGDTPRYFPYNAYQNNPQERELTVNKKKNPEKDVQEQLTLLMTTCHALLERSLVMETALVGVLQLLVKEHVLTATEVRNVFDVITTVYPPDKRSDAGFLLAQDFGANLQVPFAQYAASVHKKRGPGDDRLH